MKEMKDSGIEWIGEIPKNWEIHRLKSVLCERKETNKPVVTDFILSLTNDRGVIPYTDKGNHGNKSKEDLTSYKLAYPNDIILNSMNVVIGSVNLSNYFGCVSPVYYMLYPRNAKDDVRFFNYIFQTKEMQNNLKGLGNGILEIRMRIQMSKLNNVEIPIPHFETQKKISDFLDDKCGKIDRIIAKEKEEIEKLNEYKDSLIEITITNGLNRKVDMVKSELKWIDEIPKDWKKYKLSQLCSSKKYSMVDGPFGSDMKNEEYVDEGVPIVQLTNIKKYNHYIEKLKFITRDKHLQLKRHTALKGDIAIAKMMPAGRACILSDLYDEYVVAADAIRFSPDEIKVDKRFVLYCLNTYGMVECELESKGTTRIRISLDIARNIKLYLPKLEEQTSIADFLDKKCNEIEKTIKLKEVKIEKLEAYKKALIYECVTGKREVK